MRFCSCLQRIFLDFSGDILQTPNAQKMELTLLVSFHVIIWSLEAFVMLQCFKINPLEWLMIFNHAAIFPLIGVNDKSLGLWDSRCRVAQCRHGWAGGGSSFRRADEEQQCWTPQYIGGTQHINQNHGNPKSLNA